MTLAFVVRSLLDFISLLTAVNKLHILYPTHFSDVYLSGVLPSWSRGTVREAYLLQFLRALLGQNLDQLA